ncbi:MAG: hypothetical protein NTX88_00110, partial [Candidatus Atribacteria bacterium]|nr:hypothetical protein [Candidatus Atribacteria bacterium]
YTTVNRVKMWNCGIVELWNWERHPGKEWGVGEDTLICHPEESGAFPDDVRISSFFGHGEPSFGEGVTISSFKKRK